MPDRKLIRIPKCRLHKPTRLAVVRLSGRDIYLGPYTARLRARQSTRPWWPSGSGGTGRRRHTDDEGHGHNAVTSRLA